MFELSKSQKKVARELIQKGLQIECKDFLQRVEKCMQNFNLEAKTPHDKYLELYKEVTSFDEHVARRYDDVRGSTYVCTVVGLYCDEVLNDDDIKQFDDETREVILRIANLNRYL